jgi:2-methylcitrate dehydratase PrpD
VAGQKSTPSRTSSTRKPALTPNSEICSWTSRVSIQTFGWAWSKDPQFRLCNNLLTVDHCLDYMVIGHCKNPKCVFQNMPPAKPNKASIQNFMEKVLPVLVQMIKLAKQRASE